MMYDWPASEDGVFIGDVNTGLSIGETCAIVRAEAKSNAATVLNGCSELEKILTCRCLCRIR
jgi:hypothetical protein